MKVRGTSKASEVSTATQNKHVVAVNAQAQAAIDAYTSSTFVLNDTDLTGPVDADGFDFTDLAGTRSARKKINASVTIYQHNKRNPPQGNGEGKPVDLAINGVATNCEIGAYKDGTEKIKIDHFMKV